MAELTARRAVPGSWIQSQVKKATQELRSSLPPSIVQLPEVRDMSEQLVRRGTGAREVWGTVQSID